MQVRSEQQRVKEEAEKKLQRYIRQLDHFERARRDEEAPLIEAAHQRQVTAHNHYTTGSRGHSLGIILDLSSELAGSSLEAKVCTIAGPWQLSLTVSQQSCGGGAVCL